ncbi:MAG: hypothetical protein LBD55_00135 [Treponema sp.]|jgi:hypothetical protein|nr:hypothetical protein [Treponema sp.]
MADKLEWLNKHLVLIRYTALKDVIEQEGYKIRPDLEELFTGVTGAEAMIFKFAGLADFKAACELMAHIAHRRAGVWWGYRCILSLLEELQANPAADRDIADIGAKFEPAVPDWAKVELPPPPDTSGLEEMLADMRAKNKELFTQIDPEMLKYVQDAVEVAFQEFKRVHGIHPLDLIKKLGERLKEDTFVIDPDSPVFKAKAELHAQLAAVQKETVETIKAVIPPKVPGHEKKVRDNALAAVYRWVSAPDQVNSQKCLDIGNECPGTPAGLLSLSAFWAYGDLLPLGEQTVPTPPGLAANGLCQALLMCALHKGGTRKVKERYKEYFRLGLEVLTGADNWGESLEEGKAPHEKPPAPPETKPDAPPSAAYKRWKPENL